MTSIVPFAARFKRQLLAASQAPDGVSPDDIDALCREVGHRFRACFWTPALTLLTFLRQVLHGNCSCRHAVQLTLARSAAGDAGLADDGEGWVSGEPSAYSQARQKLPRALYERLAGRVRETVERQAHGVRLWCGRRVRIVDGSSVSMPDTSELQKHFPQPSGQKPGCGFPVARLVALFCWSTGALQELLSDSLHVGELTLFRRLLDRIEPQAVVLGDRYFGSYYDLALLRQRGLDGVFRLHQRRSRDGRRGAYLGDGDRLVTWTKPKIPSRGVNPGPWADVPETLRLRQVQVRVEVTGFRSRRLTLVTTLLDAKRYPPEALADLYRDRWQAELNLRSLKTTLRMETLRCRSVEMVRKELRMYQMAYNLIRLMMWQAARRHGRDPRRLSVAGTQQRILAFAPYLSLCRTSGQRAALYDRLLELIAADAVPDRPGRVEPRAVKRRPKNYRRLTRPRREARMMRYFIDG